MNDQAVDSTPSDTPTITASDMADMDKLYDRMVIPDPDYKTFQIPLENGNIKIIVTGTMNAADGKRIVHLIRIMAYYYHLADFYPDKLTSEQIDALMRPKDQS